VIRGVASPATLTFKACAIWRAVAFHCAVRVVALKALRFAAPALRAAIGLDRASREPRMAIIDGHREPLDDAGRGRYSRSLIGGCYTAASFASPDAKRTNRRPQVTIRFLLDDFLLGRLFASQRFASRDSAEPHSVLPNSSERVRESTSTLDQGRRIMAERRRTPRGRRGQARPARRTTNGPIDHRLRALVRTLARHAAREAFDAQVKAHSPTIQ